MGGLVRNLGRDRGRKCEAGFIFKSGENTHCCGGWQNVYTNKGCESCYLDALLSCSEFFVYSIFTSIELESIFYGLTLSSKSDMFLKWYYDCLFHQSLSSYPILEGYLDIKCTVQHFIILIIHSRCIIGPSYFHLGGHDGLSMQVCWHRPDHIIPVSWLAGTCSLRRCWLHGTSM